MEFKAAKLLSRFVLLNCVLGVLGCNTENSEWPPWEITGESSLITAINLPFVTDEINSLGRIFYDLEREQIYFPVTVWERPPPNVLLPRLGRKLRTDYYYIDTDRKALEKTVENADVVDLFKRSEFLLVSDVFTESEIYEQPFGNLALKSSVNQTSTSPVLTTNFPPGTGYTLKFVGNGTLKIEITTDKRENVFSLSEKYIKGSEGYYATFSPDGLYAVVKPHGHSSERLFEHNIIVIGELPVIKNKTEIKAIVQEEIGRRVEKKE